MKVAALPENESERLQALAEYEVLDTPPDPLVDGVTELAARICDAPIALVSLLDHERQWFMSNYGLAGIRQTPREISFCSHAVLGDSLLEVRDASKDFRFHDNPLVVGDTKIRFYAGVPLRDPRGFGLGTLCVMDRTARTLTDSQRRALADLSHRLVELLVERKAARGLLGGDRLGLTSGTSVGIWEWDIRSGQLYVSPRVSRLLGYAAGARECDFIGWAERVHPDDRARVAAVINRARTEADEWFDAGFRLKHKSGAYVQVRLRGLTLRDEGARAVRMAGSVIDIGAAIQAEVVVNTVGRDTELTLVRANRALQMLRECNRLLVRAQSESELLKNICHLIVDHGGYRFAWVGIAYDDPGKTVRPVAKAGIDDGYLDRVKISWADTVRGQGPTGRAIRQRTIQVCRNMEEGDAFAPWRREAAQRGFLSSIALPVFAGRGGPGSLNIYSERADPFDAAEVDLLRELSWDLAYGMAALRTRSEHRRGQQQLRLFRVLLEHSSDLIYVVDAPSGRVLDANNAVSLRLGYTRGEVLRMRVADFSALASRQPWTDYLDRLEAAGSLVTEGRHRTKSGEIVPVEINARLVEHDNRSYVIAVTRDITERKRQQEQIERQARVLRMQSGVNAAVLHITNRDELLQEACRLATEVGGYNHATFSIVENGGRHAIPRFRAGDGSVLPEPAIIEIGDGTVPDTSLSGRALRTRKIEVCGDLRQSEPPVAMRERAIELGYRSMVALPLIVDGQPVAALMLISRDAGLVRDAELLGYLQQMMASLSFALRSQQHADTVQFLACYDQLTGLAKRSLFCERVQQVLRHNVVLNNRLAVVAFDVRNLSNLNDTFGRQFGDLVLQKIAERFKHFARSDEDTGYLGGGTFVLLEPQLAGGDESMRSLLEASVFGDPVEIEGRTIRLSCCCGIARYPEDGIDSGTLVQRAEAALKHAKESGEQYLHYKLEMHSQIAERLELEHKLRVAIDEQQFELYYQPQVHLESGRVESVEALLRWNDPATGVVEPARFLEVLEASGMIVQVGHWVLNQAVRDCERWVQMGIAPLRVAVNVSAVQLRQRAFVRDALDVSKRLSAHVGFGIDLEITETAVLHDIEGVSQKLRELRAAGFRIALDDFGTGYSSLGLLSKLPVDLLKIDRSFVNGLPDDAACMALVESITRLASSFQLTTVVEGVETEAQLETLRAMRCSHWQGFLMSPPLPAAQIERLLTRA